MEVGRLMSDITVYTKPACVQCNATRKAFDKLGIEYRIVDVAEDAEAYEYVLALGYLFFLWFSSVSAASI
jgi:glutaredoxin-like protein NrdH